MLFKYIYSLSITPVLPFLLIGCTYAKNVLVPWMVGPWGAPHRLDPTLRTLIFFFMIDIPMVNDNRYGLIVALSIFKRHWGLNMVKYYPEGQPG